MALEHRNNLHKARTTTCDCGGDASLCTCGPDCACPGCANNISAKAPGFLEYQFYLLQYRKAVAQNKPLVIWVGETCPACEKRWTNYVHARLSEYDGVNGVESGPEVIVARPDDLGGMTIAGRLQGIPQLTQVTALLGSNNTRQATANTIPLQSCQPALCFQPMIQPMMPMMGGFGGGMMGGFGGGFGGGGCGGGG